MEFNEDAYWEEKRAEYDGENREVVTVCKECGHNLYDGSDCYLIDGEYYCEDCISNAHTTVYAED